jgi:hypothetical protein
MGARKAERQRLNRMVRNHLFDSDTWKQNRPRVESLLERLREARVLQRIVSLRDDELIVQLKANPALSAEELATLVEAIHKEAPDEVHSSVLSVQSCLNFDKEEDARYGYTTKVPTIEKLRDCIRFWWD